MDKNKVLVKELYRNTDAYVGKTAQVSGWVKTLRDSKNFGFIELNDGSFFKNVQIVFDTNLLLLLDIYTFQPPNFLYILYYNILNFKFFVQKEKTYVYYNINLAFLSFLGL